MEEQTAPGALWLLAVFGGPIALGLVLAIASSRKHRRRVATPGDAGPSRLAIDFAAIALLVVALIAVAGWWAGFFTV